MNCTAGCLDHLSRGCHGVFFGAHANPRDNKISAPIAGLQDLTYVPVLADELVRPRHPGTRARANVRGVRASWRAETDRRFSSTTGDLSDPSACPAAVRYA